LRRTTCPTSRRLVAAFSNIRVDFGPGYRIYFGRDGDRLVILLAGGTKQRQPQDIRRAKVNWEDYRNRKTGKKHDASDQRFSRDDPRTCPTGATIPKGVTS
jgi:hypothetical protein